MITIVESFARIVAHGSFAARVVRNAMAEVAEGDPALEHRKSGKVQEKPGNGSEPRAHRACFVQSAHERFLTISL
jgi:hypothetical protein